MTYLAHRLICLALLTLAMVFTGCKSAQPEAQATDGQQVQIPTPEPETGAAEVVVTAHEANTATTTSPSVVVNTPQPVAETQVATPASEPVAMPSTPEPVVEATAAPVAEATAVVTVPVVEAMPAVEATPAEASVNEPQPLWSLKYPRAKEQFAGDLAITVIQDKKTINLTNRTIHSFKDVQVWVNQEYVTRVDSIPVGQATSIALKSLVNRYGEKYPTPGFFSPDRSFPALLVEVFVPDQNKRFRLIVQKTHSQF